jgi:hypothetical protein
MLYFLSDLAGYLTQLVCGRLVYSYPPIHYCKCSRVYSTKIFEKLEKICNAGFWNKNEIGMG